MMGETDELPHAGQSLQGELSELVRLVRHALSLGVDQGAVLNAVFDAIHEQGAVTYVASAARVIIAKEISRGLDADNKFQ